MITKSSWLNAAPPRVQFFVWCVVKEKTLTKAKLKKRALLRDEDNLSCIMCNSHVEDVDHLFVKCDVAKGLWTNFINFLGIPWVFANPCVQLLGAWNLSRLKLRLKCASQLLPSVIL